MIKFLKKATYRILALASGGGLLLLGGYMAYKSFTRAEHNPFLSKWEWWIIIISLLGGLALLSYGFTGSAYVEEKPPAPKGE